jgi:hypothetical protein
MLSKVKIAPQFSIAAEELRATRPGDVVELGQRVFDPEVVVEIAYQRGERIERITPLLAAAGGRDDADFDPVGRLLAESLEIAEGEEQQIARHPRAGGEGHALGAVTEVLLAGDRHVADGHLRARHRGREVERRLIARFVEHRREAAAVGRFELGEQPAHFLAGALVRVIEREKPVRLGVDLAGVGEVETVGAGGERPVGAQAHGLAVRVERGRERNRFAAVGGEYPCRGNIELVRVERQHVALLEQLEVDALGPGERQVLRIGHEADRIVRRPGDPRQVAGDAFRQGSGRERRSCGCGRKYGRAAGKQQRYGGGRDETHEAAPAGWFYLQPPINRAADWRRLSSRPVSAWSASGAPPEGRLGGGWSGSGARRAVRRSPWRW